MVTAMVTACGLWGISWMMGKRLDSGWGILLPCIVMPLIALMELSFAEWRMLMVVAFLATAIMLFHKRLRHYLLLPSCVALIGGMVAMVINFGTQ